MSKADRIGHPITLDSLVESIDRRISDAKDEMAQLESARKALVKITQPKAKRARPKATAPKAAPVAATTPASTEGDQS